MRVLVGTDGSIGGQSALRWATGLAVAAGAELVIASAWQPTFVEVSVPEFETLRGEAGDRLDGWAAAARVAQPSARTLLLDGDPREQLLLAGDAEAADLVVVGSRSMEGHSHAVHLGSVTHHLVHHTRRPLAAIPASTRSAWPAPVVVGVDGSEGSLGAIAWCARTTTTVATEVVAVHAEEPRSAWMHHAGPRSSLDVARAHAEEWVAPLRATGVAVRVSVAEGDPVDALIEAVHREQAGLLVVGSRGLGGISGLRLGATALKVLHHGQLPVVMVPAESG